MSNGKLITTNLYFGFRGYYRKWKKNAVILNMGLLGLTVMTMNIPT